MLLWQIKKKSRTPEVRSLTNNPTEPHPYAWVAQGSVRNKGVLTILTYCHSPDACLPAPALTWSVFWENQSSAPRTCLNLQIAEKLCYHQEWWKLSPIDHNLSALTAGSSPTNPLHSLYLSEWMTKAFSLGNLSLSPPLLLHQNLLWQSRSGLTWTLMEIMRKCFLFRFYSPCNWWDIFMHRNFQSVKWPYVYISYCPLELLVLEFSVYMHLSGGRGIGLKDCWWTHAFGWC